MKFQLREKDKLKSYLNCIISNKIQKNLLYNYQKLKNFKSIAWILEWIKYKTPIIVEKKTIFYYSVLKQKIYEKKYIYNNNN